jgi:hypothetical protein
MNEFIYRDIPNLPSQNDVIAACAQNGDRVRQLTYLSKDRKFFIKYGSSVTIGEAKTQQYFYEKIYSQRGTTFKIPEIYRAFEAGGRTYIVMEYIDIVSYASDEERANAVAQLVNIEHPSSAVLGPIGGGPLKHIFFADCEAPRQYSTVDEIQTYVNNVWFALSHVSFLTLIFSTGSPAYLSKENSRFLRRKNLHVLLRYVPEELSC